MGLPLRRESSAGCNTGLPFKNIVTCHCANAFVITRFGKKEVHHLGKRVKPIPFENDVEVYVVEVESLNIS
jgi:hypothetical protein